jgi:L-asparagine oxygenase
MYDNCDNCTSMRCKVHKAAPTSIPNKGLELTLPTAVANQLHKELRVLPNPTQSPMAMRKFLRSAKKKVAALLPDSFADKLDLVRYHQVNPSYILIKGCPVDETLPDTPTNGAWSPMKESFVSEAILLGIGQQIGMPYGFSEEKDGKLLHQIAPVIGKETEQSSASSSTNLGYHIEVAYHETMRPNYVVLYCLRSDIEKQASTIVVDLRNALAQMPEWAVEELKKPNFVFSLPVSFGGVAQWSSPMPVIKGDLSLPECVLDFKGMLAISEDKRCQEALDMLETIMHETENINNIYLEKGDLLFIPNRYTAHGRSFFKPRYDGQDRWLQRIYLADSLWQARSSASPETLIYKH